MEKIIYAKDIAAALNLSVGTVYQCMTKSPKNSPKTVMAVREYAESVGYDSKKARGRRGKKAYTGMKGCKGWRSIYIKASPFETYDDYLKHCLKLRENGWTNAEIAKSCGCSTPMVRHAIGRQPEEYTAQSMKIVGARNSAIAAARRERAEALRKAEERKRLQKTLESLQKDKEETLAKMNDMSMRFKAAYSQKYETYKGLVDMIEATERQIEEVA